MRRRIPIDAGMLLAVLLLLVVVLSLRSEDEVPDRAVEVTRSREGGEGSEQAGPSPVVQREVLSAGPRQPDPTDAGDDDGLAQRLAEDPNTHVVCDLSLPVERAQGYLAIGGHSDMNGRRVEVVDGKVYLPLVYDLGDMGDAVFEDRTGTFSLEGYGPTRITWSDPPEDGGLGHCTATIAPEPGTASLTGTLTLDGSGEPADGAWIEGCGNMAFADQRGIVHMDIVPEPCTVLAMRQDGLLRTMSEPVDVVPIPGEDVLVDIAIPEHPRGGLGVRVAQTDEGIVIDGLIEGGPAGEAGLEAGDLVLQVDGADALGLPLPEFVELVGGRAGTDVALLVDRGGQQLSFTVTRRVL